MTKQSFLPQLQHLAKEISDFPPSHHPLTAFFWRHAWLFWLLAAFFCAYLHELGQGRC